MRIVTVKWLLICLILSFSPVESFAEMDPPSAQPMDPAILQQLNVLDLKTAQRIALENSPTLAAADERVKQASERVRQAEAEYWPTLDAEGSASRVELANNQETSQTGSFGSLGLDLSSDDPREIYRARLVANWIVFDGFRRHFNTALAEYDEDANQAGLIEARRLLLSAVASSYYIAQLARKNMAIAEADEAFNKRQLEEAQARYRVGTGSLSDRLNFEVQVNAARSARNDFTRDYEVALVGLAALMGVPDAYLPPALKLASLEEATEKEMTPPDPADHLDYALRHRSDIQQTESILKQTEAGVGIARSRFYPSLQFTGSLDGERTNSARFEGDDFGNTIGLFLNYRLYSGGTRRALLAEAKFQQREAEENLLASKIEVSEDVQAAVATVRSAQFELELQRRNAALVLENRDLVEKEYQAGQASLVRLNEAQRDLIQAQSRLALARVGLRQALKDLDAATGRILLPFGAP